MSKVIKSLKLESPVTDAGEEKQFIDIVKPTVGMFREANKKAAGDDTELGFALAEKCSGLSPFGFAELDLSDALKVVEIIAPFLNSPQTK